MDTSCATGDVKISKHAVAISFSYREEILVSVPTVLALSVLADQTNMTVTATVLSTTAGGTLYCGAYKSSLLSTISITRSLVKSSGYSVAVAQQTGPTTGIVSISNLIAATNYSVYCHIEDSLANKGSVESMLEMKREVSTLCCRDITFSEVSNAVRVTTSPDSQNIFSFMIPSFPPDGYGIDVAAIIEDEDGNIPAGVSASPAVSMYNDDNRNLGLSRSIVVFADSESAIAGSYSLRLELSGDVSGSYASPESLSFRVLSNVSLISAPAMSSAIFSDSGRSALVCFDGGTNQGESLSLIHI